MDTLFVDAKLLIEVSHSFDYEKRLFTVIYKSKVTDKEKIISRVEDAGSFTVKNWIHL